MKLYLIILSLILTSKIFSQQPDSNGLALKTENYFSLRYDNDLFDHTDRYYTQGIKLTFIHPILRFSPFSRVLIRLNKGALNYYGFQLQQDVYTPISIRHEGIYYGERPYSALFLATHSLTSLHTRKRLLIRTSLDMGLVGPAAMGAEEQKAIHKATNNQAPLGWENQIANAVLVNYNLELEKGIWNTKHLDLIGCSTLRLGSLYTDLGGGLYGRIGIFSPYFNNLGLENDPRKRKNKLKIYVIGKLDLRAVGYNATLQGGLTCTSSVYTLSSGVISRFVVDCEEGIVVAYKHVSLLYSNNYITPEFKNGIDHGWGRCVVTVCF